MCVEVGSSSGPGPGSGSGSSSGPGTQQPSVDDAERRKILLSEINHIDNRTNTAADNGLFDKVKQPQEQKDLFEEIHAKNKKTFKDFCEKNIGIAVIRA